MHWFFLFVCLFFNDYFRDGAASLVIQGMNWRSLMCFTLACLTFIFLTVNSAVFDCGVFQLIQESG